MRIEGSAGRRLIGHGAQLARFGVVGVAATLTHLLVLTLLVETADVWPPTANVAAFVVAFLVSYVGHRRFTFASRKPHAESLSSYFVIATAAAIANFLLFVLFNDVLGIPYLAVFVIAMAIVSPSVYLASHTFAFGDQSMSMFSASRARASTWIPAALMFAAAAALTLVYHHPLPTADHWDLVPLYDMSRQGSLGLGDIFAPHGGHWHASAYVVLLVLARLTSMSHLAEVSTSLAIAALGGVALYRLVQEVSQEFGKTRLTAWLMAVAAFFFFSLDQAPNWLWGWQVAVFLNTSGAVAVIWLLGHERLDLAKTAVACACAAIAIYAFAVGLALLPIGAMLIGVSRAPRDRRWALLALWLAFSALLIGQYVFQVVAQPSGYVEANAPSHLGLDTLLGLALYSLTFLGGAIGRFSDGIAAPLAVVGAVVGGLSLAALHRHGRLRAAAPGVALALYGVGAAALTALGRIGFGYDQALVSRYVSFSNFYWLGILFLALPAVAVATGRRARRSLIGFIVLVLVLKIANVLNVVIDKDVPGDHRRLVAAAVQIRDAYPDLPADALAQVSTPDQSIVQHVAILHRYRLSIFREVRADSESMK